MSAEYRRIMRPPRQLCNTDHNLTFDRFNWNWHTGYSCPGERLHKFCLFFCAILFSR